MAWLELVCYTFNLIQLITRWGETDRHWTGCNPDHSPRPNVLNARPIRIQSCTVSSGSIRQSSLDSQKCVNLKLSWASGCINSVTAQQFNLLKVFPALSHSIHIEKVCLGVLVWIVLLLGTVIKRCIIDGNHEWVFGIKCTVLVENKFTLHHATVERSGGVWFSHYSLRK